MNNFKRYFLIVLLLLPAPAFAYLDPGTGGMLFSALVGIMTTLFFMLKGLMHRLKYLPEYLKGRKVGENQKYKIAVYSEGGQYWNVFYPILEELSKKDLQVIYLTSNMKDPGLKAAYPNYTAKFIGEGIRAFFFLNVLEADVVLMTTPGLDVFQLKRSKGVKHYIHIVHGMEDTSTYAPYGVDYFDSVMVNGEHQMAVIRELEEVRGLPQKKIEIIGSPYLDVLSRNLPRKGKASKGRTILVAPSWGEKGFLTKFGSELLRELLRMEAAVIVRPHPQSLVSEKEFLEAIQKEFAAFKNIEWDFEPSGLASMVRADIMISDFSGIIFDYIFLLSRPVVVANFAIDPRKYDMASLKERRSTLMSYMQQGKIGYIFEQKDVASINTIIDNALTRKEMQGSIKQISARVYCHPGEAGRRGADFIEKIYNEVTSKI